jgi:2-oxoglutarate dehydrogenase E1 component
MKELARFPNAEIYWCQEEPQNMGAWWFAMPRIDQVLKKIGHKCQRTRYFGRPESASTAAGSMTMHRQEQEKLVRDALGIRGNGSEG